MQKETKKFKLTAIQYSYTESKEISRNPRGPTKTGISNAQVTCNSCTSVNTWNGMDAKAVIGGFILTCECGASEKIHAGLLM
jgi:hypothetical protein